MENNENAHAAANQTKEITPAAIAITSLIRGVELEKKKSDRRRTEDYLPVQTAFPLFF